MTRLFALASWCLTCVAISLAVVAALAVPPPAVADSGDGPWQPCAILSGTDYKTKCCQDACQGDPACQAQCCQEACGNDQNCFANCSTAGNNTGAFFCPNCTPTGCGDGFCWCPILKCRKATPCYCP